MKPVVVEISSRSIVRTVLIIAAFLLAWQIRFILLSLLTAYILMSGLSTLADFLHEKGVNKLLSAVLAYGFVIIILGILLFSIIPPLILQLQEFFNNIPSYTDKLNQAYSNNPLPGLKANDIARLLSQQVDSALNNVLGYLLDTINGIFYFVTVAVLSFYLLLDRDRIKNNLFLLFPHLERKRVTNLAHKVEKQLGLWLRGEFFLMLIVGTATYVGLRLLNVDYAMPLAIIAGLLEAIAVVGPILSAVPAIMIPLVAKPFEAIGVLILYFLIQQLENNLIVPRVMHSVAGINPLVTLLSILIGASLFGFFGAIVAVPTAAILQVIVEDYLENKETTKVE